MYLSSLFRGLSAVGVLVLLALPGSSQDRTAAKTTPDTVVSASIDPNVNPEWIRTLTWRSIGPANMAGRIIDLSVFEADPTTYWVATASGGLLKTTNNGVTFEHQFDREATVSIGSVCVAPSDRNVVWVGTGEYSPRNSVSYGDGVYKSTDGGKNWKNMGLGKTFQIGKVIVHPKDPNTVYVGALGRLYGPDPERGLFKTTDGGQNWQKILYVDDKTGVIDAVMHPTDPNTLVVAMYERERDIYDGNDPAKKWGPGGGLYKTTDGGKSFNKLAKGLPTCALGRVGIDYYRNDPNTLFIILESEKIGMGPRPKSDAQQIYLGIIGETPDMVAGAKLTRVTEGGPAEKAGLKEEDVITGLGGKDVPSYEQLLTLAREFKVGDKVKVRFTRAGQQREVELTFAARPQGQAQGQRGGGQFGGGQPGGGQPGGGQPGGGQGGGDPNRPWGERLGGQQANVQDQQGPEGPQYGGVYKSTDGGDSWTRINSINPRPMYFSCMRVDPNNANNLYVLGVSLARSSDGGKTFRTARGGFHADQHALWINPRDSRHMVLGTDGGFYVTYDSMANWDHLNTAALGQFYHVALDTRPRYRVYGGLQDNGSWGGPSRSLSGTGPVNEDWFSVGSGDGFVCQVDPNDPDLVYSESQNGGLSRRNLRTGETTSIRPRPQQGQRFRFNWKTPFILSSHNSKIYYTAGNYVFRSLDRGNDMRVISPEISRTERGSATAIAESPRNPNVLYVGTDDGMVWTTRDGGKEWKNVTASVGLPGPFGIATIEASRFVEGRAYVAFDAHRSDNDDPFIYVTEDYGQTWKSLRGNLPWGSSRCLREDIQNANVLYLGTEFAAWTSANRGASWVKLNNNLPTVAIHDFAQHPTTGEIVAATHGRSLWVLDVTPLRQITKEVLQANAHLYQPTTAVRWKPEARRGGTIRRYAGTNPANGAAIYYSLNNKAEKVSLKIVDYAGKTVRDLTPRSEAGLHRASWDLSGPAQRQAVEGAAGALPGAGGGGARRGTGGGRGGAAGGQPGQQVERQARGAEGGTTEPGAQPDQPGAGQRGGGQRGGGGGAFQGRGGFGGPGGGAPVAPGMYRVVLTIDGKEFSQGIRVEADPSLPTGVFVADEVEGDEEEIIDD